MVGPKQFSVQPLAAIVVTVAVVFVMAVANQAAFALPGTVATAAPSTLPCRSSLAALSQSVSRGATSSAPAAGSGGLFASALALAGVVVAAAGVRRRQKSQRGGVACAASYSSGLSSGGSGFYGAPVASTFASSYAVVPVEQSTDSYENRSGAAGMGMRAQVWEIKNTGFDGHPGKIFDWKRRESRRRGEEEFRHDTDKFEFCLHSLISAPGAIKKKVRRGRGKYGSHGRSCGFGNDTNKKQRGRRTTNPGYAGAGWPLHKRIPKLSKEEYDSMKPDEYTHIHLNILNMCNDGDEIDYEDLFLRGLPVTRMGKFSRTKVVGEEKDEFTKKNLTVYAHAFNPEAREKIEELGGRCIRLHRVANIPIDESFQAAAA